LIICLDLQEFKTYYDVRLGRKKLVEKNGETADNAVSNGNSSGIASNGNFHGKKTSDKAIYEQFQSQVQCLIYPILW
jgi:katanin p60 ATPase-containing subunit A1